MDTAKERMIEGKSKEELVALLEFLMGSHLLKEIIIMKALAAGDLKPEPNKPVSDDEVVIGELMPIEKAFYLLATKITKDAKKKMEELKRSEKSVGLGLLDDCSRLKNEHSAAMDMLWVSIKRRLANEIDGRKSSGIGVRDENKIVLLSPEEKCDCVLCSLGRHLNSLGGIQVIKIPV